jgi:hypothetical protein
MNGASKQSMAPTRASVAKRVRAHVLGVAPGEPFNVRELLALGPRASVDQALSRMARNGEIERVARGLYARPRVNETLGRTIPVEPEKVVAAIARASGAKLNVHGAEAARRFGLTTQVPMRQVYTTSGRSRRVHLRTGDVTLLHAAPSRMELAGTPAGEALSALLYLGKKEVTPAVVERVKSALPKAEFARLRSATTSMPAWLSDCLYKAAGTRPAPTALLTA